MIRYPQKLSKSKGKLQENQSTQPKGALLQLSFNQKEFFYENQQTPSK